MSAFNQSEKKNANFQSGNQWQSYKTENWPYELNGVSTIDRRPGGLISIPQGYVTGKSENNMGFKSRNNPVMCEAMLPHELNTFYASFDRLNKESAVKPSPPSEDMPQSISCWVWAWVKHLGLVMYCVQDTCVSPLVDVITHIFNISASEDTFKTTTQTLLPNEPYLSHFKRDI